MTPAALPLDTFQRPSGDGWIAVPMHGGGYRLIVQPDVDPAEALAELIPADHLAYWSVQAITSSRNDEMYLVLPDF